MAGQFYHKRKKKTLLSRSLKEFRRALGYYKYDSIHKSISRNVEVKIEQF